jgi:polyphosphate kinase
VPATKPLYQKEESNGIMIDAILSRYPQHKRVLYLKAKYDNNEVLSSAEIADLKRFQQILS